MVNDGQWWLTVRWLQSQMAAGCRYREDLTGACAMTVVAGRTRMVPRVQGLGRVLSRGVVASTAASGGQQRHWSAHIFKILCADTYLTRHTI